MKNLVIVLAFVLSVVLAACAAWTKQDTQVAEHIGTDILCAIEHAELDDPALNAACGLAGARADAVGPALVAHRKTVARRVASMRCAAPRALDGGVP